ncbi:hypothetical protein KKI19_02265 [Patescibacteria group bacterium]|nr:hypothetical protein [Patescibacteria group bacterium]
MKRDSSGQALLIILLVMAVALTIGLSVVSRSITDIRISQEQEQSARAFLLPKQVWRVFWQQGEPQGALAILRLTLI